MRIAWFTPFHRTSAIGRFSAYVTSQIAKSADVDIWHPPAEDLHPTPLRTIAFSALVDPPTLAEYDLCIYHLGNHLPNHQLIFETSRMVPGVVVLHDFVMHNFFAGYYLISRQNPAEYVDVVAHFYGDAGRDVAQAAAEGRTIGVWDTDRVIEFPLFEPAIVGAYGVVIHSEFFRQAVARCFREPVRRLFLAYDAQPPSQPTHTRRELEIPAEKILAVTVGHVIANKRLPEVIKAISSNSELAQNLFYAVVGPVDPAYQQELTRLARKQGVEHAIRFVGQASDELLSSYLVHADVCVNLRCPTTEGASASAIEEMLYGKPLIVTNVGFYSDLPSDAVFKIPPEDHVRGVRDALLQLRRDPALRKRTAARARDFARQHSHASVYANGILDFAREIMDGAPILRLTDSAATKLAAMGVPPEMPLLDTITRSAYELFCANGRERRPMPD